MLVFLESPSKNPYFNLAMEEYLFTQYRGEREFFLLWQNDNTIVVGRHQNTAEEINAETVQTLGVRVARRLSGGGAVYHDTGNLNYTFITEDGQEAEFDFQIFARPVVDALTHFGVPAEFNGRNDLTIRGLKFCGNSQYAKRGRILHHGCIMLDSNLTVVADVLRAKEAKFRSKSSKSVRSRVTTINQQAPCPIAMEQFKQALLECVSTRQEIEFGALSQEDLAAIRQLQQEKYETCEWNFGNSPAYDVRLEEKFPMGLVTAYLSVEQGCIRSVRFFGDFFGNEELNGLEQQLEGVRLDDTLESKLEVMDIDRYMKGISAKELCHLLR